MLGELMAAVNARRDSRAFAALFGLTMLVLLLAMAYSVTLCALCHSVGAKRPNGPAVHAFLLVAVLPVTLFALAIMMTAFSFQPGRSGAFLIFAAISGTNAWLFATMARRRLQSELRRAASEPKRR